MPRDERILTPSQLNTLARDLLEGSFPSVLVEGEISGLARPGSGHLYFNLKDARAQVRCALFKPKSQWLQFTPRDGLRVVARGRLTLYEQRGDYQLVCDTLEEAGEGALRQALEALKARLLAEGLFDFSRKRPLPKFPRRIAVLTSPTGAVIRDIVSVLRRRFPLLEVELLPVPVQGEGAAAQIRTMLQAADACGRYDVLLLARGGGSLEDLWAFNDEALTRAVAACTTPVISAVGHETDFSLTDFAADVRAPTPSAAAELLAPDGTALATQLAALQRRLQAAQANVLRQAMQRADRGFLRLHAQRPQARLQAQAQRLQQARQRLQAAFQRRLDQAAANLRHIHVVLRTRHPQHLLDRLRAELRRAVRDLRNGMRERLEREDTRLEHAAMRLRVQHPRRQLDRLQQRLEALRPQPQRLLERRLQTARLQLQRLADRPQALIVARLQHDTLRLRGLVRSLHAVSPSATIARGFSILQREQGQVVRRIEDVAAGERLHATVTDGLLLLRVEGCTPHGDK
ncbi:MAG: exodeoxyribonuclease VII large subunit [Pseudomonadota bacterium]